MQTKEKKKEKIYQNALFVRESLSLNALLCAEQFIIFDATNVCGNGMLKEFKLI